MAFTDPIHETDLSSGICVVSPSTEPYRMAAERLRTVLEGVLPSTVDVLPDEGVRSADAM